MLNTITDFFSRAGKTSKAITDEVWNKTLRANSLFDYLDDRDELRLRHLTEKCLSRIPIVAGKGMEISEDIKLTLASQICLPILNLGIEHYEDVKEVVVYDDLFLSNWQTTDRAGVVHTRRRVLSGESWQRGPVILSWANSRPDREPLSYPSNVVIHEFAHKLDQLNGSMNGMPPLHTDMHRPAWTQTMSRAFELLQNSYHDPDVHFDPYAATKPAEFFAVCSEYFFVAPDQLFIFSPEVYTQLKLYYRQDPLSRMVGSLEHITLLDLDGEPHLPA